LNLALLRKRGHSRTRKKKKKKNGKAKRAGERSGLDWSQRKALEKMRKHSNKKRQKSKEREGFSSWHQNLEPLL